MISPDVLNKASQTEYKHNLHPRTISIFGKLNSKLEILKKRQIFFHQKFKGIVDSIRNSLDELNAKFLVDFQELFERDRILLEHLKAFKSIRLKNDDRDQHRISEFYRKILLDLKKDFKSKLEAVKSKMEIKHQAFEASKDRICRLKEENEQMSQEIASYEQQISTHKKSSEKLKASVKMMVSDMNSMGFEYSKI
ncbi:MAG: hypothetical protein MHMPM18_005050, partial [Marteilia pararefringens]